MTTAAEYRKMAEQLEFYAGVRSDGEAGVEARAAAALREAAEMVRDHEAVEKLRAGCKPEWEWLYDGQELAMWPISADEPPGPHDTDPADAILGGEPHGETLKPPSPSARRGLAQTLRSYARSPCLSLDLSHALDCAAEMIDASEPTPEALEAWAEWFDGQPDLQRYLGPLQLCTPGYLLREIARRLRAAREE